MSHTHGPWEIQYLGNGESEVLANGPDRDDVAGICIVAGGLGSSIEDACDYESQANARLIAAAPELLAALVKILNDTPVPGNDAVLSVDGFNQARAAIKKAREG